MILTKTQAAALEHAKEHGGLRRHFYAYWVGADVDTSNMPRGEIFGKIPFYGTVTVNVLVRAGYLRKEGKDKAVVND